MKKTFLRIPFLLFLVLIGTSLFAQEVVILPVRIDTVFVVGNNKTNADVILREIPFSFPDTLDEPDFRLIQNRIQNLYLFNRVELHLSPMENRNALIISVTESWYIFPVPILFVNERDWNKISYGLQFTHFNFRGNNEKFSVGGWLGYNPSYFLNYYNPWLGKKSRIILGISLSHNRRPNKIFDFDENWSSISFSLGRQFSLKFSSRLSFSYRYIKLPEEYRSYSFSGDGKDRVLTLGFTTTYDGRDLFEYPRKGSYHKFILERTGFTSRQPQFWRARLDNRVYVPLYKKLSLALRNLLILNKNKLPIYDRVYLGYDERIRGYYKEVLPAPAEFGLFPSPQLTLSSLELRVPLLPLRYFSWKNAPVFSGFYQNLKFGIDFGLFIDSGIAWERSRDLALSHLYSGYGAGLHFRLPYFNVLRVEYAWNDRGTGQVIVDIGIRF